MNDDRPTTPWQQPVLELILAILKSRVLIAGITGTGIIIALFIAMSAPRFYRASAVIILLPREKPILDIAHRSATMDTSEDEANREESASLTLPPNPELYITLIRSRSVLEALAAQFRDELMALDDTMRTEEMIATINGMIGISSTEDGLMTITITAHDADLCAGLANAIVGECERASKAIERQLLTQQAGYLDNAVSLAESRLDDAEGDLRAFALEHGLVDPEMESDRSMRRLRELDIARTAVATDLAELRTWRTDRDPAVVELTQRIDAIDTEADRIRAAFAGATSEAEFASISSTWQMLRQRVVSQRDLLETLQMRHHVFRIRSEQPAGNMAVLHEAIAPERHAGPSRKAVLVLFTAASFLLSCGLAIGLDQLKRLRNHDTLDGMLSEIFRLLNPLTLLQRS